MREQGVGRDGGRETLNAERLTLNAEVPEFGCVATSVSEWTDGFKVSHPRSVILSAAKNPVGYAL